MSIFRRTARCVRTAMPLAFGLVCASSAFGAISVTDVSVSSGTSNVILKYRLNEAATTVSIQVSGGVGTVSGTVTKGLNTVSLPIGAANQTATITATAPAENGTGGATLVIPVTSPDNRATPTSTTLVAVDVNKRLASKYLGYIYLPTGFGQNAAGQKNCWVYASDGTLILSKDLSTLSNQGSWPYGGAVAQTDTQDRVVLHNRSGSTDYVLNPDLTLVTKYTGLETLVPGMCVVPNTDTTTNATLPWHIYQSDDKSEGIYHLTADLATTTGVSILSSSTANETSSSGENSHDIAVDLTDSVMFRVQVEDGGTGPIDTGGVNKWTSTDHGTTWVEDTTWQSTFIANVNTDLVNAGSTLTASNLVGGGIGLAPGFSAADMAHSDVWIAVSGGTGTAFWNRIYRVNASTAVIEQTIDVQQIPTPAGGVAIAGKAIHFLEPDHVGNLCVGTQTAAAMSGQSARYFAVLGPNQTGANTTTLSNVSLQVPLTASGVTSKPVAANTGSVPVTFTVTVVDSAGIATNNDKVTADLTQLGGGAGVVLTRGTVLPDGKSAPYTTTFVIPNSISLDNGGSFDIPFQITSTSNPTGIVVRVTQKVYNAYAPQWTVSTTGPVNSSPATNGTVAYAGDDSGKVYAVNTKTGALVSTFGASGSVSLGETVKNTLVYSQGRLYVTTTGHVYVLNGGSGATISSAALANVSSVAVSKTDASVFYVAAGNAVHKITTATGAQAAVSSDFGVAVDRIEVSNGGTYVAGGTEGDSTGKNGQISLLNTNDMSAVTATPIAPDVNGPVRSRPAFASDDSYFTIGGATGLYAFDTGGNLLPWSAGSDGGQNVGGDPYTPGSAVDANPAISLNGDTPPYTTVDTDIVFGTVTGQILVLSSTNGERVSFGGYPVTLATNGGFAAGGGVLSINTDADRAVYAGSDANDKRFFGLDTKPDDITYNATAALRHIFDPSDTSAFPGAVAGAFNSTPALAGDKIVIGSAASRIYGFTPLTATEPYVASVSPANGASGITAGATITLTFSADMSFADVSTNTVTLTDDAGNSVPVNVVNSGDNLTYTVQPLSPLTTGRTYTLNVSNFIVQPFSSTFFTGTSGPTQLVFHTQPGGVREGATLSPQPVIYVADGSGNPVSSYNGPVTLSIKSNTGFAGATLTGTTTVNAVAGVATFTNLSIDLFGTGYVLHATTSSPSLSLDSAAFNITERPFVTSDVQRAQKIAGGLLTATADDKRRYDIELPTGTIDERDATRIARKSAGKDTPNP